MDKLNAAKLSISEKLAEVDAEILARIQELNNLDIVIAERKNEIKALHDIEVVAESLDVIKEQHATFLEESEETQRKIAADHNELIANRAKSWKQEEEEHRYQIVQRNQRDEDAFKFAAEQRKRVEDLRVAALVEREKKITALEAEVAGLPVKLADGIKTAVATATESMKTKYEHEKVLAQKDFDSKNALLQAQVTASKLQLEDALRAKSEAQSVADKARAELNQIAREAVQASSGREALKAVQDSQPATPAPTGRGR
jgi:membrane protein involved in colicin uptake